MFDFIRNLTKSEAERRQEMLSAYLDDALTPREKAAFEEQLRSDSALRASLEAQRLLKENISRLPRMRAPRNFTLDPAAYGRPTSQSVIRLYPIMRAATALAAVVLIVLFSLELFNPTIRQTATAPGGIVAASERAIESENSEAAGAAADEEAALEPAEEAPTEALREVEADTAGDAAEAVEEEMAEAETAEEPMAEEQAVAEETATEAEGAAQAPPPVATFDGFNLGITNGGGSYPAPAPAADGGAANASPTPTIPTAEQSAQPTAGEEGYVSTAENDNFSAYPALEPTIGLSLTPTVTNELEDANTLLYSATNTAEDEAVGANIGLTGESTTESPIRFVEIGLAILFVVLLAATLLLRRQL